MKLNYKRTFLIGLAFFSISIFWQMYDHIIPLMLKYTFNINEVVAGGVMAIDNVLALFMLPLFGALSDRTNTKIGKRMPFIVFGTLSACLFMLIIPFSNSIASLPLFILGLGLTLISMATYRSPAVALMPDLTISPLRSKGNAIINVMGVLGAITILGITGVLLPDKPYEGPAGQMIFNPNYFPMFIFCIVIMLISVAILFFSINEVKLAAKTEEESRALGLINADKADEGKAEENAKPFRLSKGQRVSFIFLMLSIAFWFMGYNAVTTHFSKYCLEVFKMSAGTSAQVLIVAQAAALVAFVPSAMLATKFGRKKVIMAGIVLLTAAFASAAFFKTFSPLIFVFFGLAGIAWACINVNSLPMVVEFAQLAEVGRYTGFYYTASMSAQILTPILSGAFLEIEYRTLLPYGAICVAISFVTMLFVKHGDVKPSEIEDKAALFHELD